MAIVGGGYPMSRCSGVCASSGRGFATGETYVAALIERDGQRGLERLDFGAEAWDQGARPAPPARLFGFWRAVFTPGEVKTSPLLGDAELLDLFEELAGASEPKQVSFRYFLTLLLIRRRLLRLMGTRAGALLVLPKGATGEPQVVADPGLDETAVSDAIEQLGQIIAVDEAPAGAGA